MLLKPEKIQSLTSFLKINKIKLTFTKLSKFKAINPPPVNFGGLKHFRNTNKYNDCVFDEP